MKKSIVFLCSVIMILSSCTSEKEKLKSAIALTEKELKKDTTGTVDFKKALDMTAKYEQYSEKYPDDTLSAIYLYKAADVAAHSHNTEHAIALYKKVVEKYPDYKNTPNALFFIGFLYENDLKNKEEAIKAYQQFLKAYPDNEQAETARWLLQNINTSDADLIRKFENMPQNADSTSAQK